MYKCIVSVVSSTMGISTRLQELSGDDPSSREHYDCAREGPATWLLESRQMLLLLTPLDCSFAC